MGLSRYERAVLIAWGVMLIASVHLTAWADPAVPLRRLGHHLFVQPVGSSAARYEAFQEVKRRIGPEDSVAGSSGFLAHLAGRREIYSYPPAADKPPDWLVLSSEFGNPWPLTRTETKKHLMRLQLEEGYGVVWQREGIYLFERHEQETFDR